MNKHWKTPEQETPEDGLYVLGAFDGVVVICTYGHDLWLSQEYGEAVPDCWTILPHPNDDVTKD